MAKDHVVTLVDKQGNDFPARSPAEVSNLVFGAGYKPKSGTIDQALASFADSPIVEELALGADPQAPAKAEAAAKAEKEAAKGSGK